LLSNKRKIQIGILIFLIFLALIFLSSNAGKSKSWNPVVKVLIELLAPVQKCVKEGVNYSSGLWDKYVALIGTHEENKRLKAEINRLVIENSRQREVISTFERIQKMLKARDYAGGDYLAAQVIGRDPTGWFMSVIIDKGKNSGIKESMPVVNADGVVGQIVSVSYRYSKVLLLIDQNSAVDCIIERSRDSGIVKGISSEKCSLDYVLKTSDVRPGDIVVTSGLDRVFPKGNHIGKVIEVMDAPGGLFKDIKIKPSVDFARLEEVLVILREDPLLDSSNEKQ
jgi:rod shape-determining protein MreC